MTQIAQMSHHHNPSPICQSPFRPEIIRSSQLHKQGLPDAPAAAAEYLAAADAARGRWPSWRKHGTAPAAAARTTPRSGEAPPWSGGALPRRGAPSSDGEERTMGAHEHNRLSECRQVSSSRHALAGDASELVSSSGESPPLRRVHAAPSRPPLSRPRGGGRQASSAASSRRRGGERAGGHAGSAGEGQSPEQPPPIPADRVGTAIGMSGPMQQSSYNSDAAYC